MARLQKSDPEIYQLTQDEEQRQQATINLIASENYTSAAIREVSASSLTNKYAEGYPGKRYYAGCGIVDQVEQIAIDRCKAVFGADHANVQPHAGSQANMAVYTAALKPGDTIMGMSLAHGGHLTHGHPVNISGKLFKSVQYGVDSQTELIDYEEVERLAHEHKPRLIIAGASAYSRIIDFERFAYIARDIKALLLVDMAHIAGLIAAGIHPSPVPHADFVSSTTHKTLRGPRGGFILSTTEHAEMLDRAIMPGTQGGPFMHIIAAKAVAFREAQQPAFVTYQQQVVKNAQAMAQQFADIGYRIVAGGTDNHLFVLDLRTKSVTGRVAERALEQADITVSRSCIPNDPQKPWITSGIRIGTPAITTRGATEQQAEEIANLVDEAIKNHKDKAALKRIAQRVKTFLEHMPIV